MVCRNEINNTIQALDVIARYDFDFGALWRRSGDFSTNIVFSIVSEPLVPCCAVATALAAAYQGPSNTLLPSSGYGATKLRRMWFVGR